MWKKMAVPLGHDSRFSQEPRGEVGPTVGAGIFIQPSASVSRCYVGVSFGVWPRLRSSRTWGFWCVGSRFTCTTVRPQRPCTLAVVPGYVQLTCVWGSAVSVNLFPGG